MEPRMIKDVIMHEIPQTRGREQPNPIMMAGRRSQM